jgi:hypothetical protein
MTMIRIRVATVLGGLAGAGIGFHKRGIDQRTLLEKEVVFLEKSVEFF